MGQAKKRREQLRRKREARKPATAPTPPPADIVVAPVPPPAPDPPKPDPWDELTRADLALLRVADRDDWPVPFDRQVAIVRRLVDVCDPDTADGALTPIRTVVSATRALAALRHLRLKQLAVELAREKLELKKSTIKTPISAAAAVKAMQAAAERYDARTDDDCERARDVPE